VRLRSLLPTLFHPGSYFGLLVCLVALTLMCALVDQNEWTNAPTGLLLTLLLLAASFAVSPRKHLSVRALCYAGVATAMWFLADYGGTAPFNTTAFKIAAHGASVVFLVATARIMLSHIFTRPITLNKVCGAACVYILIGFCFALLHGMTARADPAAYRVVTPAGKAVAGTELGAMHDFPYLVYFSFCTLSTLGYGDIVPASRLSRTLSWFEAVSGQLYLAILVAGLVGLHVDTRRSRPDTMPGPDMPDAE
jgi:voltage-gated potassium channel